MDITDKQSSSDDPRRQPLALHIRRLRQWYGKRQITQEELAALSGLTARQVSVYERTTRLPRAVEDLLRLSIALDLPMEKLIAPHELDERRTVIEERRSMFRIPLERRCRGHGS